MEVKGLGIEVSSVYLRNEVKGLCVQVVVEAHLPFERLEHAPVLDAEFAQAGDAHE